MSLCTSLFCGSGALSPCPESADACPPRQHVRLSHEAEQSHRFPVSSASCFDSPRFSDDHSGGGRCWTRFRQSPAAVRAQVAGKASLKTDLEAAGFTVNLAPSPTPSAPHCAVSLSFSNRRLRFPHHWERHCRLGDFPRWCSVS